MKRSIREAEVDIQGYVLDRDTKENEMASSEDNCNTQ